MESINIEEHLASWLDARMGVPVLWEVPNPRPSSFVTVERTGGQRDSVVVDRPVLAIQCWAASRAEASRLAYEVDALLPGFACEPGITKASRNSLYNHPDTDGAKIRPRYQIVADLVTTF